MRGVYTIGMGQWSSGYDYRRNAHKNDGIFDELFPLSFFSFFVITKSLWLWYVVNKTARNHYKVWRIKSRMAVLISQNISSFASDSNTTFWKSDHSHFFNLSPYPVKSSNSGSFNPPFFTSYFAPWIIDYLQRGEI